VDIDNHPLRYAALLISAVGTAMVAVPLGIAAVTASGTALVAIAGTAATVGTSAALSAGASVIAAAVPLVGAAVVALVVVGYLIYKGISWLCEEPPPVPISDKQYLARYDAGVLVKGPSWAELPASVQLQLRNEMRAREAKRRGIPLILEEAGKLNQKLDPTKTVTVPLPGGGTATLKAGAPARPSGGGLGAAVAGAAAGFAVGNVPGAVVGGIVGLFLGKK
jgi:hypothetical protein